MESFQKHGGGQRQIPHNWINDRFLGANKRRTCLINYYGNTPTHAHREKPRTNASEDISGRKSTEILEEIVEVIQAQRAVLNRKVYLLTNEDEKLDELHLDLLWLKPSSDTQESAMSKNDTPTCIRCSKH